MVAYIRKMSVEKKGWLDPDTFDDGVALCQAIPGATAMQTAAYVGLKLRGVMGAAASYIGFGLPAFLIMMLFSALYTYTHDLPIMMSAFSGLQAIIVAIIANATLSFGKTTMKDWRMALITAMAAALFGFKVHPILVIFVAGIAGLILVTPKARVSNQSSIEFTKPDIRKAAHARFDHCCSRFMPALDFSSNPVPPGSADAENRPVRIWWWICIHTPHAS